MAKPKKVIITCAVTGAIHTPSMSPHLPITPSEIIDDALNAAEAGAAVLHLHARDPETGRPYVTREQLQGMAEGAIMMNTLDPIRRAAITEGSYYQEADSERILKVDQAWTNAATARRQDALAFTGRSGQLQEMVSPGGTSFQSQQAFYDKQQAELQDMKTGKVSELIQQDLGLTYDELAGMTE